MRWLAGVMRGLTQSHGLRRSIEAEATCIAYANRAMAHLKADDAAAAEADCSAALQLDATYLKAWLRRASARKLLGRRLDAIDDLEQAARQVLASTLAGVILHLTLGINAEDVCLCAMWRRGSTGQPRV